MKTRTEDLGHRRVVRLLGRRLAGTYGRATRNDRTVANKGTRRVTRNLS